MQRTMNPNMDLKDMACRRRGRLKKAGKGRRERNEAGQGAAEARVGAGKSELSPDTRSRDSSVTLSVVTVQVFHERINKLRTYKN